MSYDRADWHYGGDYPSDLPPENGGTHIGVFLAWAIHRGLIGEFHLEESLDFVERVKTRQMTGREFLFEVCDEKFWEQDLSDEGNMFARDYYETNKYFGDFCAGAASELPSAYHAPDTWSTYDKVAPRIDRAFARWRKRRDRKWWQFWRRFV